MTATDAAPATTTATADGGATRTVTRTCHLCEAMCGLLLEVDDERVLAVRGNPDDPLSRGYLCPKGAAIGDLQVDPDRLRLPLVREGDELVETDWTTALDRAAAGLRGVAERHGPDSLAVYLGNPNAHSPGALFIPPMIKAMGTTKRFSASTVDQRPQEVVSHLLYGSPQLLPVPDLDRTSFFLVVGANPVVSNGSLMTAPDMRGRIKGIRDRGGRVVVVDPRRTETARLADRHVFVRPGSDPLLLAAMLQVLFDEDLVDLGEAAAWVDGVDALADAVRELTPERVAERTGVDATVVRELARAFAVADGAVAYGRVGLHHQRHGTVGALLVNALNVVTGNLDRPGGAMFTTPALDLVGDRKARDHGRWSSRISGTPEFMGELPAATMADEILEPGEGQVRGMLVSCGNPVLSIPGGERLDSALDELEFMVAIDVYVTETSRHADVVLPSTTALERAHFDHVFNTLAVRNVASWDEPVFERPDDAMHDHEIYAELAARLAGTTVDEALGPRFGGARSPEELVALGVAFGPWGQGRDGREPLTLDALRAEPTKVDLGPLEPQLPGRLRTRDGRLDVAPALVVDDLVAAVDELLAPPPDLVLIGRRQLRSNNSWMHNSERLVKGRDRCTLLLHPDDAAARGLEDGQQVVLRSRVGEIEVPLEVSDEVMPGVTSLPHGWGHDRRGVGWTTAAANPGASVNDVTDPSLMDAVCGNAALSEVAVEVLAASG